MSEVSTATPPVTACLIIIGNEILSGRTRDANLAFIGRRLNDLGVRLMEARIIPDIEATIAETVNETRARFDYVFTSGGIGPTHDDITAQSVARAFGVPLIENPEARALLEARYGAGDLNEARLRMARTPAGATLIENPISTAPGFRMDNVFVMAGIPEIMRAMFESLAHDLRGGTPLLSRSLTLEMPEGRIAKDLGALQEAYPDVEMGSYPFNRQGRFGTRLVLRCGEPDRLAAAARDLDHLVTRLGGVGAWDATPGDQAGATAPTS